jgi:hypothetical protein
MLTRSEAGKLGFQKSRVAMLAGIQRKHDEAVLRYTANPKSCRGCGSQIPYEGRAKSFCNHSCAAKVTNKSRLSKPRTRHCAKCPTYVAKGKYCSSCRPSKALTRMEDAKSDRARKRLLVAECGRTCDGCKNTEWQTLPIPLDLDHVDGNSDNNERSNLRLLCPNCHALTPTYKGRNQNKNSTRQARRRQRYAAGKTF